MTANLSHPTTEEIYYAVERYLENLPEALQAQVAALLAEVRAGHQRDNELLDLISSDETARRWLRTALFCPGTLKGNYIPLAGIIGDVPASSLWCCPHCDWEWRVMRKGRPVPPCPKDNSQLVQLNEKP